MQSRNYVRINYFKVNCMNTTQPMEDRLWDYIDGLSSPAERSAIEELIAANQEWLRKYRELLDVHQLMTASELDEPPMRFTKKVMEEIARFQVAPATKSYINKNVIRGFGAFFLTMIAGFFVYFFREFKWTGSGNNSSNLVPSYNLGLEKFNYEKVFSSTPITLFMLVMVILGFVLLDMYLQRKKQQATGGSIPHQ
jgi:hypothetical protein